MATRMSDVMAAWRARQSTEHVVSLIERMDPADPDREGAMTWAKTYHYEPRSRELFAQAADVFDPATWMKP